jgi:hypothetical protein
MALISPLDDVPHKQQSPHRAKAAALSLTGHEQHEAKA